MGAKLAAMADRHWRWVVLAAWLLAAAWMIFSRWTQIRGFALGDTDDNMRIAQVRALLAGQDWYDLRQYKLDPPRGADIHWSRLVDLPLAGLILLGRLFVSGATAERFAVTLAPLLPYLLLGFALAMTARRLIHPLAYLPAFVALFFAASTNGMFMPTRIDHHGWQIALLALAVSAMSDPNRARGGVTLGVATALSLSIGLEMMIYLAMLGAATVLFWVVRNEERERLQAYAASLAGGTAIGFLAFASYANRRPVCDALSPVWLADALLAGALLFLLSRMSGGDWQRRLALAAGAGLVVAAFHALAWPHCLSRLEGVSDELDRLWLSNVREARPFYRHSWRTAAVVIALPVTGCIGWLLWAWVKRRDSERLPAILAAAAPALAALGLLFWQTRAGPAAQMLAVPGAAALGWLAVGWTWNHRLAAVRVLGTSLAVVVATGALVPNLVATIPQDSREKQRSERTRSSRLCPTLYGLKPVAKLPPATIFTFNDLSPRLIAVTHHRGIAGPYHRNGRAIIDVQHAFRGSAEQARAIIGRYDADYLLICPNFPESTVYAAEAKSGFYMQLVRGQVPGWLEPVELPQGSPFRLWRVRKQASGRPD